MNVLNDKEDRDFDGGANGLSVGKTLWAIARNCEEDGQYDIEPDSNNGDD